jgi:alanine-glyoxylate transaminase/serine-glyoxylate transaminase/serine-pyruvate transaminase
MEARFERHRRVATTFRAAWNALELTMLPTHETLAAHTLSAVYFPDGVDASMVGRVREHGVVIAGGLHPSARTKYFRVGHMGATGLGETLATVGAIERALASSGWRAAGHGRAVAAAESAWR